MRILVESLKRLYTEEKISADTVNGLFESGKISEEEKNEIFNAYKEP